MKKKLYLCLLLTAACLMPVKAGNLSSIRADNETAYQVRLTNGDILTGVVADEINDDKKGHGIKLRTTIGATVIYESEVAEILEAEESYRHGHRAWILPTAEPIGSNHFIGLWELGFVYGGFGISDIGSVTLGRSFVPGIRSDEQISVINAKATVYRMNWETMEGGMDVAVGGNLGFINSGNRLEHIYGLATFRGAKSRITGGIFYKAGSSDAYRLRFNNEAINMFYSDGSFGIALGLDTRLSARHDMHVIGELWNSDVTKPTNTGVMLGIRLANTSVSADFGLAFFTQPFVAPFVSFAWTPFK